MRLLQILLAIGILGIGNTIALADSSRFIPERSGIEVSQITNPVKESTSETQDEKLVRLESKIQALELRLNELLPSSSGQEPGMSLVSTPYPAQRVHSMLAWSSQDHLLEAQANHQKAEVLEGKIQKLQDRINRFTQKPYLDPKGFKRASLKVLKENLAQEQEEAATKTAWHNAQAKRILMSESNQQRHS